MPKDSVKEMNWIKEGKFSSSATDPKAYYVIASASINEGITIDSSKTHPITQAELARRTDMKDIQVKAVLWHLAILDNPEFRYTRTHGRSTHHGHTEKAVEIIMKHFPIEMPNRENRIKEVSNSYSTYLRKEKLGPVGFEPTTKEL